MLFTDSDIVTAADLARLDSEAALVAFTAEPAITVEGSGSVCEQAWIECQQSILAAMQSYTGYTAQTGIPPTHTAAVLNTGLPSRSTPRVRLNQVVAHDPNYSVSQSAIQTWMTYRALAILFRDASSRMDVDRYQEKFERYEQEAQRRWRALRSLGLPIVYYPLEAPGAKHAFNAGSWSASNLANIAGGMNASTQSIKVAITWYDASKYTSRLSPPSGDVDPQHNAESGPSAVLAFTITANSLLQVDITSLNPPAGLQDPVGYSSGSWSPLKATHWNLYAGRSADSVLYLQREAIPIATKTAALSADPVYSGPVLTQGQYPDLNLTFLNLAMRA